MKKRKGMFRPRRKYVTEHPNTVLPQNQTNYPLFGGYKPLTTKELQQWVATLPDGKIDYTQLDLGL